MLQDMMTQELVPVPLSVEHSEEVGPNRCHYDAETGILRVIKGLPCFESYSQLIIAPVVSNLVVNKPNTPDLLSWVSNGIRFLKLEGSYGFQWLLNTDYERIVSCYAASTAVALNTVQNAISRPTAESLEVAKLLHLSLGGDKGYRNFHTFIVNKFYSLPSEDHIPVEVVYKHSQSGPSCIGWPAVLPCPNNDAIAFQAVAERLYKVTPTGFLVPVDVAE